MSSTVHDSPPKGQRQRAVPIQIHAELLFAIVLFLACTSSGGVILGIGAFADKAIEEGLLEPSGVDVVANFAFQMLTWGSLVWSCLHDSLGPRGCAILGLTVAVLGHLTLALGCGRGERRVYVYAVGLGLVGAGGNGAYIASFHFMALAPFERSRGLRTAMLASAFNIAAYPLLTCS